MRPFFLSLLLQASPLIARRSTLTFAFQTQPFAKTPVPPLSYPVCRRNFTCSAPYQQDFNTIMADLKQEEICEEVNRLAKPASNEADILNGNKGEDVVRGVASKKEGKVEEKKEEKALPKLSAAEFRAYNSMAEHMEYFVGLPSPNRCSLVFGSMPGLWIEESANRTSTAQSLPPIVDPPLHRLRNQQKACLPLPQTIPLHGSAVLLSPLHAPRH